MQFTNKPNASEHDLDVSFEWILENQNKITVILDGLDQTASTFQSVTVQPQADVRKKYNPFELISLVLSRKVLPYVRLILTSRPHSILNFKEDMQPDQLFYLDDLNEEDMRSLMGFYVNGSDVE